MGFRSATNYGKRLKKAASLSARQKYRRCGLWIIDFHYVIIIFLYERAARRGVYVKEPI
jgi:hypothetical protein